MWKKMIGKGADPDQAGEGVVMQWMKQKQTNKNFEIKENKKKH